MNIKKSVVFAAQLLFVVLIGAACQEDEEVVEVLPMFEVQTDTEVISYRQFKGDALELAPANTLDYCYKDSIRYLVAGVTALGTKADGSRASRLSIYISRERYEPTRSLANNYESLLYPQVADTLGFASDLLCFKRVVQLVWSPVSDLPVGDTVSYRTNFGPQPSGAYFVMTKIEEVSEGTWQVSGRFSADFFEGGQATPAIRARAASFRLNFTIDDITPPAVE